MLKQAEKAAFTASPMDNLLNYKYQKELQASKVNQQESDKNQGQASAPSQQEIDELLSKKLDNTCYVYVKTKEKNQVLEELLSNLLQEVQYSRKELVLAASKDNNRLTRVIEQVLERQQYQYKRETVELPVASQDLASSLGSGISLFAALAGMNRNMDGEDYDDEDDKKKRKSVKRGI